MFAGSSKSTNAAIPEGTRTPVIELSDTEPEAETLLSAQEETDEAMKALETSSVGSLEDSTGENTCNHIDMTFDYLNAGALVLERTGIPPEQGSQTALQESDRNIIHISDEDSCTEETTPYTRQPGKHIFSQSRSNASTRLKTSVKSLSRHGSSREMPIVVETTPIDSRPAKPSAGPVYSIFQPRQRTQEPRAPTGQRQLVAPYPDAEAQHVRGPQTERICAPHEFFSLSKEAGSSRAILETQSLPEICRNVSVSREQAPRLQALDVDRHSYIETIPPQDQAVPSIARLLRHAEDVSGSEKDGSSAQTHQQWADRWRPKRADEVVGNEQRALYLRDWLTALRVQNGTVDSPSSSQSSMNSRGKKRKLARRKRPQVVRHVKKRRGGALDDLMQDFVAPDDLTESEDEVSTAPSSDFDDFAFCQEMAARINGGSTDVSRGSSPPAGLSEDDTPTPSFARRRRLGHQLKNTILLAGPSGSGKTAAVYACADELGWEVFEVYPGIGERNGASLNRLVGDVGRNHLVTSNRPRTPDVANLKLVQKTRVANRFAKASRRIADSSDVESALDEPDSTESHPPVETATTESSQPVVNQSLILVEEVDVLYRTDSNFWPALINIIKDCRRPVVLTCNGEPGYHMCTSTR